MSFTEPSVRPMSGEAHNLWVHMDVFSYIDQSGVRFSVLPGAVTDGASIPRLLWSLIGSPMVDHRIFKAAAVHDQLYKSLGTTYFEPCRLTRAECDRVFYRALRAAGVSRTKAALYYLGVRVGGWAGWNRYARDPAEVERQSQLLEIEHG